uniref:Barrier-to-autointegration factor n=1 Tax=Glossina austeni TaxID=7395 RepID=A0A1A9V6Y2_GLOAU
MSETTQIKKYRKFAVPVTDLPGIGNVLGRRLNEAGFYEATDVFAQYLQLRKDAKLFKEWMKHTCNASSKQATDCCNYLDYWCKECL